MKETEPEGQIPVRLPQQLRQGGGRVGDLTRGLRGEAEGVKRLLPGSGSITAKAGEALRAAGGPRTDDRVPDRRVAEPAGVAPVQTLGPGCRRDGGSLLSTSPSLPPPPPTSVQLLGRGQRSVLLRARPPGLLVAQAVAAVFTLIWKDHAWKEEA